MRKGRAGKLKSSVSTEHIHERSCQLSKRPDRLAIQTTGLGGRRWTARYSKRTDTWERKETLERVLREPTQGPPTRCCAKFPEGTASRLSQNRLPYCTRSLESPGVSKALQQHLRRPTNEPANRIAFLPHREPRMSSLPKAQINSVVPLLEKSALPGNPKILGSFSKLQPRALQMLSFVNFAAIVATNA